MVKKKKPGIPIEFWDDLPDEDPYPEFMDEVYEGFWESGLKPEGLNEPYRSGFRAWLKEKGRADDMET